MSTNISKKKRDDLLDKIKQIRAFIAAAPQDENTGNLLSYLSELEKDVNGKKYGLVFEEHREEIDEVLDTHTPVLTEDADLFIDHGVQMNFLIEGDNLASLQLLEKTHNVLTFVDRINTKFAKRNIFILTPERSRELFKNKSWLNIDLILFDEAQLSDEKSVRGLYFDSIVRRALKSFPDAKATPHNELKKEKESG